MKNDLVLRVVAKLSIPLILVIFWFYFLSGSLCLFFRLRGH